MKAILFFWLALVSFSVRAQTVDEIKTTLKTTNSPESASSLEYKYPSWQVELIKSDTAGLFPDEELSNLQGGEFLEKQESGETFVYKLLEKRKQKEFRVSHIFLYANPEDKKEMEAIRAKIFTAYANGSTFADLSRQYSNYAKPQDGDLGWFAEGVMVQEFESEIKNYKKGDIFPVDVASKNWYYVVLKTHNDREIIVKTIVKIKSK